MTDTDKGKLRSWFEILMGRVCTAEDDQLLQYCFQSLNGEVCKAEFLNKTIEFFGSSSWTEEYGGFEAGGYVGTAINVLKKHPVDMLVFEMPCEGRLRVRSAGYRLDREEEVPDEETILYEDTSQPIRTFWLKIDDYGDRYVGTFLFPEDY